ncbi:SET domain-containing protein [candidate division WWE3 bacterium]|uniref:SET domain-containing protein n=1 Tax=candidate division WWE3 bacterium TaxID=2053526 RepID=A0A7X9E6Z1_UNCKA|nr:SET domain-containing protein [candidate division WWE3 bacterium]
MSRIEASQKIFISKSKIKGAGKGVFAKDEIIQGDIIERCPVIEVSLKDPANNDEGKLVDYFFYFGEGLAIALGFGSLYNHSYNPNATYKINLSNKTIDFIAIKILTQEKK